MAGAASDKRKNDLREGLRGFPAPIPIYGGSSSAGVAGNLTVTDL
jgi:hypothetical protein